MRPAAAAIPRAARLQSATAPPAPRMRSRQPEPDVAAERRDEQPDRQRNEPGWMGWRAIAAVLSTAPSWLLCALPALVLGSLFMVRSVPQLKPSKAERRDEQAPRLTLALAGAVVTAPETAVLAGFYLRIAPGEDLARLEHGVRPVRVAADAAHGYLEAILLAATPSEILRDPRARPIGRMLVISAGVSRYKIIRLGS